MTPTISIYVPSIRPENWATQYESLFNNEISFEIIYVGHVYPTEALPKNVKHIYSRVKPAQCAEIGLRASSGEFCIFSQDDITYGDETLDLLVKCFRAQENDKVAISCMPYLNHTLLDTCRYRFFDHDKQSPITPLCGLYKKDVVCALGGIDKNFICSAWDVDLAMRLYESGGYSIFCSDTKANENVPEGICRLWSDGKSDRKLIEELWTITNAEYLKNKSIETCYMDLNRKNNGVILKHRKKPVELFPDMNILTISQRPKGRWI